MIVVDTGGRVAVLGCPPHLGTLSNGTDGAKGHRRISKGGFDDLRAAREWGDDAFAKLGNLGQKWHRREPTHWYARFWRCCRPPLGLSLLADASTPQASGRSSMEQSTGVIWGLEAYALADRRTSNCGLRSVWATGRRSAADSRGPIGRKDRHRVTIAVGKELKWPRYR